MNKGSDSPAAPQDPGRVSDGASETSPEKKNAVLLARAKSLSREPEQEGIPENCIEVLEFLLAHEIYAIETAFIREVYPLMELTPLPCTPAYICGIINIRGQILTIVDIKKFFDLPEKGITDLNRVIVVRNSTMELGILADDIIGIHDIAESGLHPPLSTMTGIHAEYIRGISGTGRVLLNMERLLGDRRLIVHEEVE